MNILDLDPQEFEGYFLEGYDERTPEENEFLLEAYRKRNSALSPAFDAVQTSEIDGGRRLNVVPATIPQGMTFFDALREGEADLAVPGMLLGGAEAALSAVDMPAATMRGPVSERAMRQAATDTAGMMALGAAPAISRAAAQGVDPSMVRSAGPSNNLEVSKKDASKIFGEGSERVRYRDPETEGEIEVVVRPDGSASVLDLQVPESSRGKGVGQALQERVMADYPRMGGQVSSKAAAKTAYRLGRRPMGNPDATLEDVFSQMDEMSSVNLVSPQMQRLRDLSLGLGGLAAFQDEESIDKIRRYLEKENPDA